MKAAEFEREINAAQERLDAMRERTGWTRNKQSKAYYKEMASQFDIIRQAKAAGLIVHVNGETWYVLEGAE